MGMPIGASRASTAMVSQAISPRPQAPQQSSNTASSGIAQALQNQLKLNTEGHVGRMVNTTA